MANDMNAASSAAKLEQLSAQWIRLMRSGRFDEAWLISDEALRAQRGVDCLSWPRHLQFIWDGSPLEAKRVLVRCYHGLGDTVQYARFLPVLESVAEGVIVWAQPLLIPLLRTMRGIDQLLPLHDSRPDADYDVDIEIMELPYALRTTLATLPAEVPYLHVDAARRPTSDNLAVGLVWRSGDWDGRRSIPVELVGPLAAVAGVDWYIFQHGPANREWPHAFGTIPVITDVLEGARGLRALDLLISVDTFSAHLAGALGVPVWTLLQAKADWRWMEQRDDSPWYPTMRLFRQRRAGDWSEVITSVARALAQLAQK